MKVAVTAENPELTSAIDTRFGRAKWILVVDTETGQSQAHSNKVNLNAVQGAGIQTGQNVANLEVDAVVTGNVGPNAFKTLAATQVRVFLASGGSVEEAVAALQRGELPEVEQANVEGHWV
jgi:predicted Fe-Mo cluster-binding NifX family protein